MAQVHREPTGSHFHPDPPHIPDSLASERAVPAALRTLPPETHVLVRLCLLEGTNNHEKEMDFVVLHPELGIVIIETKGRKASFHRSPRRRR